VVQSAPAPQAARPGLPPTTPEVVFPARNVQDESSLSSWPFGGADIAAAAQVASELAAQQVAEDVRVEIEQRWTAQDSTHVVSAIPAQRLQSQRDAEIHSVPPVGPNPFLACAVEGYPV
jgi:hypothetical protein